MSLSLKAFHFYVVSVLQFIVFVFYFWLIRAVSSSYVHQQHFRPRSLAFICHCSCCLFYCSLSHSCETLRELHGDPENTDADGQRKSAKMGDHPETKTNILFRSLSPEDERSKPSGIVSSLLTDMTRSHHQSLMSTWSMLIPEVGFTSN